MSKQIFEVTSVIDFKPTFSFSERESAVNKEILRLNDLLRQRGFYPIDHKIVNKNSTKATILVSYSL